MAGSVIPMKADRAEGSARPLILASWVLKATASAAPPGDVGGTGNGQPIGHAVLGKLAQVDGGVHLVNTGDDRGGIEQADDKGTDAKGQGEQSLDQTEDGILGPHKDGTDGDKRHEHGHEHGDKRGYKEVEHLGNDLVQTLLEEGKDRASDDDGG